MRRALFLLSMLGLALSAALPAAAQRGEAYCNLTEIKAEQLSNGVRITLVADGEIRARADWKRLLETGQFVRDEEHGFFPTPRWTRLPIRIYNARSLLGAGFVPVGKYPVSHVEISVPEWASEQEGVGLLVEVVCYVSPIADETGRTRAEYLWPGWDPGEDGQSYVITWPSDRFPPSPPPKTPEDLPSELAVLAGEAGLSVHAVNAKLEEVATRIAEATGLSVECPSDSNLRVSCHLERLPLAAALQAIAIGCGLCDWCRPNGSWVLTPEAASGAGYGTSAGRTIPLRYLRAREAIDLLPNFLLSYLYPDEESNAIVVTGPAWMGERVAADLAKLDTPSPEMVAEVVVVEYTSLRALSRSLGLALLTGEAASRFDSAFGEVDFQRLEALPAGWNAALSYQEASSTSRVRSRSTLRVLNGKRGRIFVGQQRNLVLEQLGSEYGGPASATLEQVDIGASLVVRPQLGEGEEMVLNLQVEVDSLSATDPITGLPIVSRRSVNSTLRAKEGDTILIAGLQTSEETRRDRAIPLLARLPLLGGLFRAPDRSEAVLRLAVFVTPHRVRDQAQDKGTAGND